MNLPVAYLLERTAQPVFNQLLEAEGKPKNKKSKGKLMESKEAIKIKQKTSLDCAQTIKPTIFGLLPLPQKPKLSLPIFNKQCRQYITNPSYRLDAAYPQEKEYEDQKLKQKNYQRYCQTNSKFIDMALNKINQSSQAIDIDEKQQLHMIVWTQLQRQLLLKVCSEHLVELSPGWEINQQQTIRLKLTQGLIDFPLDTSIIQNKIRVNMLGMAINIDERCKPARQRQINQKIDLVNIISAQTPRILQSTDVVSQDKQQGENEQDWISKVKMVAHEQLLTSLEFGFKGAEDFMMHIEERDRMNFESRPKKRIKIPGHLLYQVERKIIQASEQVSSSIIRQIHLKPQKGTSKIFYPENTKNYGSVAPSSSGIDKMNRAEFTRIVIPNIQQKRETEQQILPLRNQFFSAPPQKKQTIFTQERASLNENIRLKKNKKPLSLYEQKKKQLQDYMSRHTQHNSINLEMYTYKKSKSKLPIELPPTQPIHRQFSTPEHQQIVRKKAFGRSMQVYPVRLDNLVIESQSQCWIQYEVSKIKIKELTLNFLKDRRKFCVNHVRVLMPMLFQTPTEVIQKATKCLQILGCLGAVTSLMEKKPYQKDNQLNKPVVILAAFMTGRSPALSYKLCVSKEYNWADGKT